MPIATGNVTQTASSIYTSSGNTAITWLSICNYTAGNVVANVYVVPNSGTAGNLNCILSSIEIAANDTYQLYAAGEKLILNNGDSVQANANINNAINTVCSYTTI
jgi:hypothetical protein